MCLCISYIYIYAWDWIWMDIQGILTNYLLYCLSIINMSDWSQISTDMHGIDSTWIQKWHSTYTIYISWIFIEWVGSFHGRLHQSGLGVMLDHHLPQWHSHKIARNHRINPPFATPSGEKNTSARPWHLGQIRQQSARWIGNILQFQLTWRRGPPQFASISRLDFPWNKPSSYGGTSMTMETTRWGLFKNWAAPVGLWGSHCIVALEQVLDFLDWISPGCRSSWCHGCHFWIVKS